MIVISRLDVTPAPITAAAITPDNIVLFSSYIQFYSRRCVYLFSIPVQFRVNDAGYKDDIFVLATDHGILVYGFGKRFARVAPGVFRLVSVNPRCPRESGLDLHCVNDANEVVEIAICGDHLSEILLDDSNDAEACAANIGEVANRSCERCFDVPIYRPKEKISSMMRRRGGLYVGDTSGRVYSIPVPSDSYVARPLPYGSFPESEANVHEPITSISKVSNRVSLVTTSNGSGILFDTKLFGVLEKFSAGSSSVVGAAISYEGGKVDVFLTGDDSRITKIGNGCTRRSDGHFSRATRMLVERLEDDGVRIITAGDDGIFTTYDPDELKPHRHYHDMRYSRASRSVVVLNNRGHFDFYRIKRRPVTNYDRMSMYEPFDGYEFILRAEHNDMPNTFDVSENYFAYSEMCKQTKVYEIGSDRKHGPFALVPTAVLAGALDLRISGSTLIMLVFRKFILYSLGSLSLRGTIGVEAAGGVHLIGKNLLVNNAFVNIDDGVGAFEAALGNPDNLDLSEVVGTASSSNGTHYILRSGDEGSTISKVDESLKVLKTREVPIRGLKGILCVGNNVVAYNSNSLYYWDDGLVSTKNNKLNMGEIIHDVYSTDNGLLVVWSSWAEMSTMMERSTKGKFMRG